MALSLKGGELAREDLDALFQEYYPRIFNYLYYRTLNRAVADDLVGTVMLNIVRGYTSFDPQRGSLDAWVFRIARNALFTHFRRQRDSVDLDAVPQSVLASEDEDTDLDERDAAVRAALLVLNDEERELVYLKFWEDLSNKEIGKRLNMNASTVSTKLWRANQKMRKALDEGQ